jgi:hypothetical protein
VNVWVTDVGPFGTAQVTAIPEPASLALFALGMAAIVPLARRRRVAP